MSDKWSEMDIYSPHLIQGDERTTLLVIQKSLMSVVIADSEEETASLLLQVFQSGKIETLRFTFHCIEVAESR